jgi:hypothetical protein
MRSTLMPLAIALALAVGGCGGSAEQEPASSSSDAEAQALQERVDKLEREAKERDAEAARKAKAAKKKAQAARRKERERARARKEAADAVAVDEAGGGIVVPDVVGLDHQAAQDAMQGEGLWMLDEKDCTGQGRLLLFDRNWEVVSTDPPAGSHVTEDTTITLCSKKQGE